MAKGLLDLDPASGLNDADLLLVNQGGIDLSATVGQVKDKILELGGSTEESFAVGNHLHDDRYVKSSGGEITGPLTVNDLIPDAGASRSLGAVDKPFKEVFSSSLASESISTESIIAEAVSIGSDFTFKSGKATMSFNSAENSIDFIIN